MSDNHLNDTLKVAALLVLIILALTPFIEKEEEEPLHKIKISMPRIEMQLPDVSFAFEVKENREKAIKTIESGLYIKEKIDSLELPTFSTELTSLGKYYVTGYTSWELNGSVQTASGATCHKADSIADSLYNPTTCAADVWGGYHDFGDVLWLEDFGYFIVEDTGSAVLGKHIDLYYGLTYEDNQEALTITGYYEVFSVEYVYGTAPASQFDVRPYTAKEFKIYDQDVL